MNKKVEYKINIPLTERPDFVQVSDEMLQIGSITKTEYDQLHFYAKNGYLIIDLDGSFDYNEDIIISLEGKYDDSIKNPRIVNAWRINHFVKQLASNNIVMNTLRLLYQREPIPFQTINFPVGSEQRTHSDMIHFNSIPQRFMCGVWVALEDVNELNGALHYYPSSHRLPFYDMLDIGIKGTNNRDAKKEMMNYSKKYEVFIQNVVDSLGLKKETLDINKGQAIIWSANLLHGGDPILKAGSTRHSQVTHYFFDDCMYYTPYFSDMAIDKLYLLDIENIATGKKVPNTYFNEKVQMEFKQALKLDIIKTFSKISHLFPKEMVTNVKRMIGR